MTSEAPKHPPPLVILPATWLELVPASNQWDRLGSLELGWGGGLGDSGLRMTYMGSNNKLNGDVGGGGVRVRMSQNSKKEHVTMGSGPKRRARRLGKKAYRLREGGDLDGGGGGPPIEISSISGWAVGRGVVE